jgi:hypothetical protein
VVVVAVIKRAIICTAIVLAGAAPPVPQGRPHDGAGARIGPIRAAYHCEPVCPTPSPLPERLPGVQRRAEAAAGDGPPRYLLPPALPPVRRFDVEPRPAPVTVPAPGSALIFVPAVLALAWLRRINPRRAAGSRPRGVLPVTLAARAAPRRRARRFFVRECG